jgi:G3E family GTPase
MSFLGVGLNERFLPPIQISVVDVKNWQTRDDNNDLEVNQIQVSSLIVLTHIENISEQRKNFVIKELNKFNPTAEILNMNEIDVTLLPKLLPSKNKFQKFDHLKAHWSSCSIDLPNLPHTSYIYDICNALPMTIMRIKGCTQIGDKKEFIYFERTPNGKVSIRPFNGVPITGSKLLTIGPGSEPSLLKKVIKNSLS